MNSLIAFEENLVPNIACLRADVSYCNKGNRRRLHAGKTSPTRGILLFSYLDFRVCFACYPPESFKIICLTCIWLTFVDTSFHSTEKQRPTTSHVGCHFSKFFEKSLRKAHNWLNLLTSCGPNWNWRQSEVRQFLARFFCVLDQFWSKFNESVDNIIAQITEAGMNLISTLLFHVVICYEQ